MASSGILVGVVPAPPGQVANFVNPPTLLGSNIALHTVLLFFATLCVAIRLYTRRFITHQLGLEDYLCILSFCLIVVYSSLLLACAKYTLGHHLWDITLPRLIHGNKVAMFLPWSEYVLLIPGTIKLSCLLFYRSVFFRSLLMRRFIYGGMFFVLATSIALTITTILDCIPIEKHYNPTLPGVCLSPISLAYSSGAVNVATDFFVVFLPIPTVWRLNQKLSRRLRVMTVFGLGTFVVAMSITRLATTHLSVTADDTTWSLSKFAVYSTMEMYVGLICACLLTFPPFIDRYGPRLVTRLRSYTTFQWRTTRETPASSLGGKPNRNGSFSRININEYTDLGNGAGPIMMHNVGTGTAELVNSSTYKATVAHETC